MTTVVAALQFPPPRARPHEQGIAVRGERLTPREIRRCGARLVRTSYVLAVESPEHCFHERRQRR